MPEKKPWMLSYASGFIVNPLNGTTGKKSRFSVISIPIEKEAEAHFGPFLNEKTQSIGIPAIFRKVNGSCDDNPIRKALLDLCLRHSTRDDTTATLAKMFSEVTDKRTKKVLFLILLGQLGQEYRVVLLTLQETEGITPIPSNGKMILEFTETFPEDSNYYKAAIFEGNPKERNCFRTGRVADSQSARTIRDTAKYWMNFIQSDYEMTDSYGSQELGRAVRAVIKEGSDNYALFLIVAMILLVIVFVIGAKIIKKI